VIGCCQIATNAFLNIRSGNEMPDYFFTAVTPQGRTVTDVIDVESVAEAHQSLLDDGFTSIVMHSDDISARYLKYDEKARNTLTPKEFLEISQTRGNWRGFLILSRVLFKKYWILPLFGLALLGFRRGSGYPFGALDLCALGFIGWPMLVAAVVLFTNSKLKVFMKLIEARAWARWDDVLEIAPRVKGVAVEEIAFQIATAYAGQGNVEKGLSVVKPFSDGQKMPLHLYYDRLCELYAVAGRYAELLPLAEKAYEFAPDSPVVMIDLAFVLLRLQTDLPRCKQLAEQVRQEPLSEILQMYLKYLDAVIALEDNRPSQAEELMNEAFRLLQPMAQLSPLMGGLQDRMHMYMALIQKRQGDVRKAADHYRKAAPRMEAFRATDYLQRCRRELGAGIVEGEVM
jgi:tetratricopeptide (TPR) repeat protein